MKRKALIVMAIVVAGGLLSVIPWVNRAVAKPLRVGVSSDVKSSLVFMADSQGFFKNKGLDVVMKEFEAGTMAVDDLMVDKLDIAIASEIVFVLRSFSRPDLRMAATICMASDVDLVFRMDRGIMKPQDLQGKSVAVTHGSGGEFFLHTYFLSNRIPVESVHVVDRKPSEMVKAVADGIVDAALCWPPYTTEMAKQLGTNGDLWPAQSGQNYYFALISKEGFLKQHTKAMEQFLAALSDAEAFMAKYPERARTVLRQKLAEAFLPTWSLYRFRLQLTQDLLVLMEREAKWAIRNDLVEKKEIPNYLDFFYFDALDKVKPEAVSIVH